MRLASISMLVVFVAFGSGQSSAELWTGINTALLSKDGGDYFDMNLRHGAAGGWCAKNHGLREAMIVCCFFPPFGSPFLKKEFIGRAL